MEGNKYGRRVVVNKIIPSRGRAQVVRQGGREGGCVVDVSPSLVQSTRLHSRACGRRMHVRRRIRQISRPRSRRVKDKVTSKDEEVKLLPVRSRAPTQGSP